MACNELSYKERTIDDPCPWVTKCNKEKNQSTDGNSIKNTMKQNQNHRNHRYGEQIDGCQRGGGLGEVGQDIQTSCYKTNVMEMLCITW